MSADSGDINFLWHSSDASLWEGALARYWDKVKKENYALEKEFDSFELNQIHGMSPADWYSFLRDKYFKWKYTAANRYKSTTRLLAKYENEARLDDLDGIRRDLLGFDVKNTRAGLRIASDIHGLGIAGASGLLAILYPDYFGTVDQFVVKALRQIKGLPEADRLMMMTPESLSLDDGVLLIKIMARKAEENNALFHKSSWTPRKIDKILWGYGRKVK